MKKPVHRPLIGVPKLYTRRRPNNAQEAELLRKWAYGFISGITQNQWSDAYATCFRGGSGWQEGLRWDDGTLRRLLIAWYQIIHKPGSKEWRPSIIVEAACLAAGLSPSPQAA
jgi:hypothetical protein